MEFYNGFQTSSDAWSKQANIWATLYLIYDDNVEHMMNAFQNNGLFDASAEKLHKSNLEFFKDLENNLDEQQKQVIKNALEEM